MRETDYNAGLDPIYTREKDTDPKYMDPKAPYLSGTIWMRFNCVETGKDRELIQMDPLI